MLNLFRTAYLNMYLSNISLVIFLDKVRKEHDDADGNDDEPLSVQAAVTKLFFVLLNFP
jgi:hypothetical protein